MPRKTSPKPETPTEKKPARSNALPVKHKMARVAAAGQAFSLPYEEIERQAYFYWVDRNYEPGDPTADWLRAEEEVRQRYLRSTASTRP